MFRSGNPALNVFDKPQTIPGFGQGSKTMTIAGTVNAAFILVSLCAASAIGSWMMLTSKGASDVAMPVVLGSFLGGLLTSVIMFFSPRTAPFVSPVYAICEGILLGAISLVVAARVGGPSGPATGMIF